ncbi:sensory transduction histidine kinase [Azoarcus sp. CIB]|uniref:PAS domain S-box protein n=1 Tax=Aromatoleum sp. (strain CIB) TaxID=198107 RepID=UPI0006A2EC1F|nr:PAS domain S-box protein [Azoarcus sp. CIB]AKU11477.1 sensory transduction histidine kinase [Azoarcus sp. CIB]
MADSGLQRGPASLGSNSLAGIAESPAGQTAPAGAAGPAAVWLRIIVVAAMYVAAGLLARALTQSSGYASPVWPAAGVALAALLGWGVRCWPGVWLGTFVFTLQSGGMAAGAIVPAFVATGATAQALLGYWLTKRFLLTPISRARTRDLARFLLLAGPGVCLVAASIAVGTRLGFGRIASAEAGGEWLAWWAGDTLGVLLFAPLMLLAWPGVHPQWVRMRGKARFSILLLLVITLLSAGSFGVARLAESRKGAEISRLMDEVFEVGFFPLPGIIAPLEGVEHFINSSEVLSGAEFTTFTGWITRHPAVMSIDWAPRVLDEERERFERAVRAEGSRGFYIFEPGSDGTPQRVSNRAEYFPILYSAPQEEGRAVLGLDHGHDPHRRVEMEHARESGTSHLVRVVPLLRTKHMSLLVFHPVRGIARASWIGAGRAGTHDLLGHVVGVFDVEQLFVPLAAAARARNIGFRVSDMTAGGTVQTLLDEMPSGAKPAMRRSIEFGGRTLSLEMAPDGSAAVIGHRLEERIYQVFSVLAALLVAYVSLSNAGHTAAIEAEVAERTADLKRALDARLAAEDERDRIFDLSLDLLGIGGVDGYFKRVNPAFSRTLGWSEEEILSRPFLDLVHPDDLEATLSELDSVAHGRTTIGFENRYRCKDGTWRWLEWTALPLPDGLMLVTAHDCTQRHERAQQLRELNAELSRRVGEREAALDALGAKEEEIRAALDNLIECVVTIDARGIVQGANAAVEAVFGYPRDEVVGRNVSLLMASPHREQHDDYLARYLMTGERHIIGTTREVEGRHKLGHPIALELSVAEYRMHDDQFFIGTLRDIGERKALIAALTHAREDAEQASRAKSAFLAAMSHEIRTPMNGVVGLIEVLARSGLPEHQADLVGTIRESSSTLLRIIDDILDFSKIEAGRLELDIGAVSIADLVEGVAGSLLPVAARRHVDLSVFVAPQVPERVQADEVRLRQVLYNLVGNAIKFSAGRPHVRGRVSVRVTVASTTPLRLAVAIADNGIGIEPEKVEELFTPFTQAETSTTRRFGGTGLGLAICRRLVTLMQGEIEVRSEPGAGSTFTVTIPFVQSDEQPVRTVPELGSVNCVVVDSPEFNTEDLRVYLEHAGASVFPADDEAAAGVIAAGLAAPVVLIEFGGERRSGGSGTPAIASGAARVRITRGRRRRPRITGPDTVMLDGNALRRQSLLRAVAVAAGRASPEIFHAGAAESTVQATKRAPSIDEARRQGRLILVADDDEINKKVILEQLALLGHAAEFADDGAEALRMWQRGGYALILTDLHMPNMDGYGLTEAIRKAEGGATRIPIVALTANALQGESRRALEAGMDEYLTKPVRLDVLGAHLERWLPRQGAAVGKGETGVPEPAPDTSASALPIFDVSVLSGLVGDDPVVIREFLCDYLTSTRSLAAEARAASAARDSSAVAASSHKLKSSSRAVGALALGDLCNRIESAVRAADSDALEREMSQFDATVGATESAIARLLNEPISVIGGKQ